MSTGLSDAQIIEIYRAVIDRDKVSPIVVSSEFLHHFAAAVCSADARDLKLMRAAAICFIVTHGLKLPNSSEPEVELERRSA